MIELYPYQHKIVAEASLHQRPLLVLPTGSGKTVIASEIIRQATNQHVLFIAHRHELIHQARNKLADVGIDAGLILAGESMNQMAGIQVASVQTLHSRCIRGSMNLPPCRHPVLRRSPSLSGPDISGDHREISRSEIDSG